MQYPVPQFTDVEDRIIGPLTIKQFGIVFSAGMVIVLLYSGTKDLVITGASIFLIGLPALAVAFGKFNGRPMYSTFMLMLNFITAPKVLVFHKESGNFSSGVKLKDVTLETKPAEQKKPAGDPRARLKELNKLLEAQAEQERVLAKQIK